MPPDTQLVIGPNASLTRAQAWRVMAFAAGSGLGIAAIWTALGFWPVLPFAGAELAALGAALYVSMRHGRYREVLSFAGPVLKVQIGALGSGPRTQVELPRAWTRVRIEPGRNAHDPTRLHLEYGAQRLTIAQCLTDAERARLARRIGELLKPAAEGAPVGRAARTAPAHGMSSGD